MNRFSVGYLILSFLSGFVELGAIVLVIREAQPLYMIPLMGLAYQLGGLFREPFEIAPWQYLLALALSILPAIFASESSGSLFIAVLLLSIGIQGARGVVSEHHKVSTPVKRVSRVAGFACSGFFFALALPVVAVMSLLLAIVLSRGTGASEKASLQKRLKPGPLGWVMAIHQSHYFSYAYVIPFVFVVVYGVDSRIAGLLFCVGWLSYISSRKVFGERTLVRNFTVGHILAAASLAGIFLFFESSVVAILSLWFLTGFGGGTVYCLRELRARSTTDKSDLDSWENMGHIWGVLICLVILGFLVTPRLAFAAASFIAAITCGLFLLTQRQGSARSGA